MGNGEGTSGQGSVGALLELAAELQRAPTRPSDTDIRDLVRRLGLDQRTVRSAVRLRFGDEGGAAPKLVRRALGPFARAGHAVAEFCERRPFWVGLWLTVLFAPLTILFAQIGVPGQVWTLYALLGSLSLYVVLLAVVQFIAADLRSTVSTVLVAPLFWTVCFIARDWPDGGIFRGSPWNEISSLALLYVLLALAGGMILTFFAAAGGYVRSLRGMRQERDADRQSLLRRVFDLNARLDGSEEVSEEEAEAGASPAGLLSPTGPIALKLAGRLPLATWVFVTAVNLIVLALFRLVSGGRFDPANPEGGQLLGLVSVGGSVVLILGVFQLGVFAASLRRSLLMGVALLIGYLGAAFGQYYIMPSLLGGAPLDKIWMELIRGAIINGGIACLPVAAGAMAGAYWVFVERERKLAANDRKVLAEEIDRLQGRLHQETQQANYVVFDVVGSTRMKEGADPLAIEYSFTEYHRYVTELVIVNNGVVQSVAGDGVIASFPDADHALRASLAVQERLVDFNRHRNHLPDPFRLRVGIHCGTIIGSASGVTFSHVIDVAAHIEHACPPGKVALSYDTLQALTNVPAFQNHPQNVDGRKLAIVSPSVMELS